jgi:hypothetical protein
VGWRDGKTGCRHRATGAGGGAAAGCSRLTGQVTWSSAPPGPFQLSRPLRPRKAFVRRSLAWRDSSARSQAISSPTPLRLRSGLGSEEKPPMLATGATMEWNQSEVLVAGGGGEGEAPPLTADTKEWNHSGCCLSARCQGSRRRQMSHTISDPQHPHGQSPAGARQGRAGSGVQQLRLTPGLRDAMLRPHRRAC